MERRMKRRRRRRRKTRRRRGRNKTRDHKPSPQREEFRRKTSEFKSYSDRTNLEVEEIADDLYLACDTPLKRRLLASSKVNKESWKKTDPKVIIAEMERICLPKLNVKVERQQFKCLDPEEDLRTTQQLVDYYQKRRSQSSSTFHCLLIQR